MLTSWRYTLLCPILILSTGRNIEVVADEGCEAELLQLPVLNDVLPVKV